VFTQEHSIPAGITNPLNEIENKLKLFLIDGISRVFPIFVSHLPFQCADGFIKSNIQIKARFIENASHPHLPIQFPRFSITHTTIRHSKSIPNLSLFLSLSFSRSFFFSPKT
jgi:hypothetical protein